ncbi:Protein MNN4 [Candida viswanathii]|uniref:Protein MNN4 n=1 Tax=Candida viswanathii TaxID=5486 RepID=A0A367XR10_9ASCO|nr:Protein MNN4 [Candida viswanathii]
MPDYKLLRNVFLAVAFLSICYLLKTSRNDTPVLEHLGAGQYVASYESYFEQKLSFGSKEDSDSLSPQQKIMSLLRRVQDNKNNEYWLANTTMEYPAVSLNPGDFLPPHEEGQTTWQNNPLLYYEPRFTLAVYLDELRHQLETLNPENDKDNDHLIKLPFAWSDWVDLTALNEEISKPMDKKLGCEWLQKYANKKTRFPDFCKNLNNVTDEELEQLGFRREQLPGFVVNKSPMNKATHKPVLMQGKSYLLTHQENPLSIIFLTPNGTYEAQIAEKRERIVDGDLFERFLTRRGIDANHLDTTTLIAFDPQEEFRKLIATVEPRPLDLADDVHKVTNITKTKSDSSITRQIHLAPEYFHYGQADVDRQIAAYEERLENVEKAITDELAFDGDVIRANKLTRHESNHYKGLKYCNSFTASNEPTYYKLATLRKTKINLDTGWHYEWRFFNGAMKYLKDDSWTFPQLEIREQIILDRLLRNWFRFAETKGIVSWIAHGPLLSWYWDGLMFPYDIDIDLQMPSSELNRLALNYNMTLVIEDLTEGYGKYLIDCSTFLHHRNVPGRDNYIDARFIDIDTGSYIDITGVGINDEKPPKEYESYIKEKKSKDQPVELYMDRRKHWLTYEKINPLRYSLLGGVPVLVPNDIMAMLKHEYKNGITSYFFQGYYYVPSMRLWIEESQLLPIFKAEDYESPTDEQRQENIIGLVKNMDFDTKLRLLEANKHILIEYYLTQKTTGLHEIEKRVMLDESLENLILNLEGNDEYNHLTAKFALTTPLRKSLFDYEYFGRFKYMPARKYAKEAAPNKNS